VLVTTSGTYVGSTIGESTISYRPTFVDIEIETALGRVEKILDREEGHVLATVAELTAENVQRTLPGTFWDPIATLKTVDADPLMAGQFRHTITVGGIRLVAPQTIALISPNRRISATGTTIFSYVFCAYAAVSSAGVEIPFARGRSSVWRVDYELLEDTSRSIGDQMFQFTVRQNA